MPREVSLAEIFQLGYYWETKILLTAAKLDLFSILGDRESTVGEIANEMGADEASLELVLNALVAMRVVHKEHGRYVNSAVAHKHLVKGGANYVGHLLLLHEAEWNNWGKLEDAVRSGQRPVDRHVFEGNPGLGADVLAVLDRIGQQSGPGLAKRLDLAAAGTLLDLGGGAGTNAIACCKVYPELRATVFDLPQTLDITERAVKEAGLTDRIGLLAGDFNSDPLGGPYDAILMSDILHYQDHQANAALVRRCFAHLNPGGRLVIKDRFLDESGTTPAWVAAFAVHILVNTPRGGCYRTSEAIAWMREAGFDGAAELEPLAVAQGTRPLKEA